MCLLKLSNDVMLAAMLSNAKGQIMRVAATLHVLFNVNTPVDIPEEISDAALKAAVNVVDVCIQHAAFLAGRGDVDEEIQRIVEGICNGELILIDNVCLLQSSYSCC